MLHRPGEPRGGVAIGRGVGGPPTGRGPGSPGRTPSIRLGGFMARRVRIAAYRAAGRFSTVAGPAGPGRPDAGSCRPLAALRDGSPPRRLPVRRSRRGVARRRPRVRPRRVRGRRQRSADAVGRLVDTLPAAPRFGEKWPGHRPDAARYAEGNPTTETTGGPPRFRASPATGRSARSTPTAVPRVRPPAVGRRPPPRAAAGRGRRPGFVGRPPVYPGGHQPSQDVIAGVVAVVGVDPDGNGYRARLIDARTGRRLGRSASSTVSVLNEPPLGGRSRASGFHSDIDRDRVLAAIFIADEP